MLVKDIQVFIGFANFYWRFIQGFSKIAAPLTLMLKMIALADLMPRALEVDDNEIVKDSKRANETVVDLSKSKKLKNKKSKVQTHIEAIENLRF